MNDANFPLLYTYKKELAVTMESLLPYGEFIKFQKELDSFVDELNKQDVSIIECNRLFRDKYGEYLKLHASLSELSGPQNEVSLLRSINDKLTYFVVLSILGIIGALVVALS